MRRKLRTGAMQLLVCGALLCGCAQKTEEPVWIEETAQIVEMQSQEEPQQDVKQEETSVYRVHVCGSVCVPGVYELSGDCRIVDAVDAAGGFLEEASPSSLNLAMPLTDGMQVYVPSMEEAQSMTMGGAAAFDHSEADGRVNINTAGEAELCTLPGIGSSRAQSIIAYREENGGFTEETQIMNVPGIKDAAYAKIKDRIKVK